MRGRAGLFSRKSSFFAHGSSVAWILLALQLVLVLRYRFWGGNGARDAQVSRPSGLAWRRGKGGEGGAAASSRLPPAAVPSFRKIPVILRPCARISPVLRALA